MSDCLAENASEVTHRAGRWYHPERYVTPKISLSLNLEKR